MARPRRGTTRRTKVNHDESEHDSDHDEHADHHDDVDNANDESMEHDQENDDESHDDNNTNNNNNNNNNGGPDESTLRILLSTDNHLGYLERDPIRGLDSFAALEEVLSLARQHRVDMVLLSGDLFHDNKPSRRTLHKTMEIFRRYCMGSESVGFQIVSDQKECLRSVISGRANYEDEFYSVDLPIFAIHGNHDDPTRDGGIEMLSALDLLSVSNLVNYFGRQDQADNVQVSPVLLQKGSTKVALYGMGSMRDERLNRMWQGKKVRFLRPENAGGNNGGRRRNDDDDDGGDEDENGNNWFNIFTLHQNRDLGRGAKNCVHESMIPEWMDLVVWGHEHECLISPQESLVGTFRITQPGSSVATSLTAGESRRKQVGILDIRGSQFRLNPIPLGSVRSFALGEVNLGEVARTSGGGVLDVEDPKVEERMGDVLAAEVDALIKKARDEATFLQQDAEAAARAAMTLEDEFDPDKRQRKYMLQNPEHVLVRLKVEHSGFTTLNNQRFGSRFVGEVANPSDILLFHRRKQAEGANSKGGAKKSNAASAGLSGPIEPEDLEEINVEDLVNDNLTRSDKKMEVLQEGQMGIALDEFVSKEQSKAIGDITREILKKSQKQLVSRGKNNDGEGGTEDLNPTAIREICAAAAEKARSELALEREEATEKKKKKSQSLVGQMSAAKRKPNDDEQSDDSMQEARPTTKKARPTTSKKTTTKSRATMYDSDDEALEEVDSPSSKKRATSSRSTTTKKTATTTGRSKARTAATSHVDSSDDEIEFVGSSQAPAKPANRASRARSTAKKSQYNYDDDSDIEEPAAKGNDNAAEEDDDSVVEEAPKPRKRGAASTTKKRAPASTAKKSSQSQSTITSFTSARKPGGRGRAAAARANMYDDSDEEENSPTKNGGGWGTANSQSTLRRGRR